MYAPDNHTCSVIPLWEGKQLSFILVSMERRRPKIKISNSC